LNQSTEFAAEVQNEMKDRVGMDDRGVRQAGFLVLYKTTMPAVLIETGFLSNPVEESYLMSATGQDHIANAIFRALNSYKQRLEKPKPTLVQFKTDPPSDKIEITPVPGNPKKEVVKPVEVPAMNKNINKDSSADQKPDIWFCVQIATYPTDIGVKNPKFKGLTKVSVYQQGGLYKYIVGKEKELSKSLTLVKELRARGFNDAFVVAFNGTLRITVDEAKSLLDKQKNK
jgi:N-acetylmuramoyl-L-alanine amidase